jgi:DHA1 family bicyclomycin/chloramphenicol resistance-like MFS transporter
LFNYPPTKRLVFVEFIALMALMSSLIALSIDAMLPALTEIGTDLGSASANDNQLIVSLLFLGMAIAQLVYGPLSDSLGRKPMAYLGFVIFIIGCLICITAESYTLLLIGRVLQGVGLGGPRIMSIAIIRDLYSGREMARVMSFVMTVFILVPIIAPAIGQVILLVAHWRMIFTMMLGLGLITFVWFLLRQPETLTEENRHPLSLKRIIRNVVSVCKNKEVMIYAMAAGTVFGSFLAYLSTIQQVLQQLYGLGKLFPVYFALLSCGIGLASFTNGNLVIRFGMLRISSISLFSLCVISFSFAWISSQYNGLPPLWQLITYFSLALFCVGLLFGNLNALAMEPLGHIAGIGASVIGFISSTLSVILAIYIGSNYNDTVLPVVLGFAVCGSLSLGLIGILKLLPK